MPKIVCWLEKVSYPWWQISATSVTPSLNLCVSVASTEWKYNFFLAGRLHTVVASVRGEANCKLYYQAISWLPLLHMQLPSSTTFFGTLQHGKVSQFGDFTVVRLECSIVFVSNQLTRCPCIERGNQHCYQRVWNTVIKQNMNWKINYWRFDW